MTRIVKTLIPIAAGALVLFGLLQLRPAAERSAALATGASRARLPGIDLRDLDGKRWRLDDHRGQVVLVNFWATWCPPCRDETPGLAHLAAFNRGRNVSVVGIAMDNGGEAAVRDFVNEFRLTYPVLMPDSQFTMGDGIDGLPTTLLIDRQGRVAKTYVGAVTEQTFQRDIDRLLAEGARGS